MENNLKPSGPAGALGIVFAATLSACGGGSSDSDAGTQPAAQPEPDPPAVYGLWKGTITDGSGRAENMTLIAFGPQLAVAYNLRTGLADIASEDDSGFSATLPLYRHFPESLNEIHRTPAYGVTYGRDLILDVDYSGDALAGTYRIEELGSVIEQGELSLLAAALDTTAPAAEFVCGLDPYLNPYYCQSTLYGTVDGGLNVNGTYEDGHQYQPRPDNLAPNVPTTYSFSGTAQAITELPGAYTVSIDMPWGTNTGVGYTYNAGELSLIASGSQALHF